MRSHKYKTADTFPKGFTATKAEPKRRGLSLAKTFSIGFVLFVLLIVSSMFALSKWADRPITDGEVLPDELKEAQIDPSDLRYELYKGVERMNVLLLGMNGHLTDTIMLGSYDLEKQRVDIISIPRDTYYDRPEAKTAAQRKINAIYGSSGAAGTAAAVQDILGGVPIHYYAVVKFEGVAKVVDAVGGVTVNIPIDMDYDDPYDNPYNEKTPRGLHIHFKKGEQTLNGEDAVKFLRFRRNNKSIGGGYPDMDIGRTAAQREFMKAALHKAIGPNLPNVVKTILDNVESDLTIGTAGKLAVKAMGLSAENIQGHSLKGESRTVNGSSYWFIDEAAAEEMIDNIYNPPPPEVELAEPGTEEAGPGESEAVTDS